MKYFFCIIAISLCAGCYCKHHHSIYQYDNGNDYVSEGTFRIIDTQTQKIGYATVSGKVIISPQYTFGYPFKNGKAKVTYSGISKNVSNSDGEYHYWESNEWFFIDKTGKKID